MKTLQQDAGIPPESSIHCSLNSILLHGCRRNTEQSRHLAWMRRHAKKLALPLAQGIGAWDEGIQSIGIENNGNRAVLDKITDELLRFWMSSEARTHRENSLPFELF